MTPSTIWTGAEHENSTAKRAVATFPRCLACRVVLVAGLNLGAYLRRGPEIVGAFCADCSTEEG